MHDNRFGSVSKSNGNCMILILFINFITDNKDIYDLATLVTLMSINSIICNNNRNASRVNISMPHSVKRELSGL